ncbi:MAG: N-acetylmuramoyl-L-alanine amidase [Lachnospiraceae bacterium]|nr:N-acetylmuramoyl-L-alanine amidase [Lachnospiraceae bacterium]
MNKQVQAAESVTVVIDPGHGGVSREGDETNSGATYHGLEEKNVNLVTALAMYDELCEYGNVNVYLTRDIDAELSLQRRVEFAEEVGADVIVSIHYNASADHNFFGSEIFTSAFGRYYGVGHALAEKVMDEWVAEGNIPKDIKTRIGKNGDYYGLIRIGREHDIPTIILEHGYLDNDRDYLRIKSEEAWKRFGVMDATAVAKFYGLEKGVVKEKAEPVVPVTDAVHPVMPDESEPEGIRLEVDSYSSNKGDVDFTLYAHDDDSKLMYYGFMTGDVDKDTVFPDLELWEGDNGMVSGTYHVQPGYEGKLTAKVFNVYQVDGISNTVELIPNEEEPDDEADNAVTDEGDAAEDETGPSLFADETVVTEEAADSDWIIGGEVPAVDTTAIANAIDRNTESRVKKSYIGFIIAGLVCAITVAVALVIFVTAAAERKRDRKKRRGDGIFPTDDFL